MVCFESNRGGTLFAENVQNLLTEKGSHCHVTTKWNNTNKETRILVASSWVKTHCLFLNDSVYNGKSEGSTLDREYRTAMNQLTGYSMSAKNKHDDVADVMADLEAFVKQFNATKMVVMKRTF
jgi:predicted phage terminase large subunit-like protein